MLLIKLLHTPFFNLCPALAKWSKAMAMTIRLAVHTRRLHIHLENYEPNIFPARSIRTRSR